MSLREEHAPELAIELDAAQRKAVETLDRNLQLIACAGSGKTRVVAARVVNTLLRKGPDIGPDNVVALTFTEKAAAELKDRIVRYHELQFGHARGLAGMYVGTIHGFCLELLERHVPDALKLDLLDEVRQRLFVDRHSTRSGLTPLGLRRWVESDVYVTILRILREADLDERQLEGTGLRAALEAYQELLRERHYLDFDELMVQAVAELYDNEAVAAAVAARVRYLIVDEYQDVNPIQEALIRRLHDLGANVCVVGDDDQNIYQWRGSDVRHIVDFAERYPDVAQVKLERNFRSSPAVVDCARRTIERNAVRLEKAMVSAGAQTFERGDLLACRFATPEEEAEWIAARVEAMRGVPFEDDGIVRGLSWSDCAVLLRSVRANAAPIVAALRARGIESIVTGMTGLFDRPEVQAAEGVFRFMVGAIDVHELRRLWEEADAGVAPEALSAGVALLAGRARFDPAQRREIYNLQRVYRDFLEAIELREEAVPNGRGEIVYYNLGKFSQVISDYEEIHFRTQPRDKYEGFCSFLVHQARRYYPEGQQDAALGTPDAVRIMTVHQAKGLEFPVVFLPALQRNRFPARRQANRVWRTLPRTAVVRSERYDSEPEDERRLFYVALTRSRKYLYASWAPVAENQLYRRPSELWEQLTRMPEFLTHDPGPPAVERIAPQARRPLVNVELTFSDLKYLFECPYQFKLRLLYGFNAPIDEAMGYGRSLHNALADLHHRALAGEQVTRADVAGLLDTHLSARFAYDELLAQLRRSAERALERYIDENGPGLRNVEHAEEVVEVLLPDGVLVNGRIDLIKRLDTGEVAIIDFKSTQRAQAEDVTRLQLHVYALGYEQRFAERADLIEVHNLDEGGSTRELVDDALARQTAELIGGAAARLRENRLERLPRWCATCEACDLRALCRTKPDRG